jgi:hypothetical protein
MLAKPASQPFDGKYYGDGEEKKKKGDQPPSFDGHWRAMKSGRTAAKSLKRVGGRKSHIRKVFHLSSRPMVTGQNNSPSTGADGKQKKRERGRPAESLEYDWGRPDKE